MHLTLALVLFALLLVGLILLNRKFRHWSLSRKVMLGLVLGVLFGMALHPLLDANSSQMQQAISWFDIIGLGYVHLLQMCVMPLILASIVSAVARLHDASSLGKISALTISILLITTLIAAIIGIAVTLLFGLTANGLVSGEPEMSRLATIQGQQLQTLQHLTVPQMILSMIPSNPFMELAGLKPTSIISVVLFSVLLGLAAIKLVHDDSAKGEKVLKAIDIFQSWIMKLVRVVILLTPYGVFALMIKVTANANWQDIIKLGGFLLASYLAIGIMFVVHAVILMLTGISPMTYFRRIASVLAFAFTSRSSMASIPLNIEAQTQRFGVPDSIASFAASFGATIGQNGCAGIYPAMLAVMVAPTVGIDLSLHWLALLAVVVMISSIGVAGVGGGATFAALIVLPIMGLPIELIALLISIEPLIDMARTALNVSGAVTAGITTSQLLQQTDKTILANPNID